MKEIRNYIITGILIGGFLYLFGPDMFSNSILINEVSTASSSYSKNVSYHDTVKKVNKSVVSIYTKKLSIKIFFS